MDVCPCTSCERSEIPPKVLASGSGEICRRINVISIHCSDSDYPAHDNLETITKWHIERGFKGCGYHFVITKDGTAHHARSLQKIPAAVKGFNKNMIAICLTGKNIFSPKQLSSAKSLINCLCYDLKIPTKNVHGHNHWDKNKTCPNFDIKLVL